MDTKTSKLALVIALVAAGLLAVVAVAAVASSAVITTRNYVKLKRREAAQIRSRIRNTALQKRDTFALLGLRELPYKIPHKVHLASLP